MKQYNSVLEMIEDLSPEFVEEFKTALIDKYETEFVNYLRMSLFCNKLFKQTIPEDKIWKIEEGKALYEELQTIVKECNDVLEWKEE